MAVTTTPLVFKLGSFIFTGFEIPEGFSDATETSLDTRDHPGGGRTITAFGVHDGTVSWKGTFWGTDARNRLEQLRAIQAQCQPVLWTYGEESWMVYIAKLTPGRKNQHRIDYTIELEILERKTGPQAPPPDPASGLDAIVSKGMDAAITTLNAPYNPGIFPGLAILEAAQALSAAIDAGFPVSGLTFSAAMGLIQQALTLEGLIENAAGPLRVANTLSQLQSLVDCETSLSGIRSLRQNLQAYFGAAAAGTLVAGTSAWELAAQHYGDPAQGIDLMAANNLTDPVITSPISIVFPPAAPGTALA